MDSAVPVNLNCGENSIQKCIIPSTLLKHTNVTSGDYVSIRTSERNFVCQIYPTELPCTFICLDETVTFPNPDSCSQKRQIEYAHIPNDLTLIKPSSFEHVKLKLVLKNEQKIIYSHKSLYEDIVCNILKGYVVNNKSVVRCTGRKLAESAHIKCIEICETFPNTLEFGKLLGSTKIEVVNLILEEQLDKVREFECIQLGGIDSAVHTFESFLRGTRSRILISGPPGCGKSSFVKKFCSRVDCFFVIDGMATEGLMKKCIVVCEQCHGYQKLFPNHKCVLFIDHLDVVAPRVPVKKSSVIAVLFDTIEKLKDLHVSIIAAATHRNSITPKLSSLFNKEINLGMPSLQQRKEIVKALTASSDCNIDYDKIARLTPGFVGHDLSLLIKEAINSKEKLSKETHLECLTTEDVEKALCSISPSVLKTSIWNMRVKPVYWNDIGGMFHIKQRLQMCIEWPLLNPEVFKKVDLPCPRGVLLFGPPGCCKTTLARGLATECNANFFAATPAQIYSPYVGESEKNITELFYQARQSAPSIIFLDEIDSLVSQRKLDKKSQGIGERVLSALLNEMDGFGTKIQLQSNMSMQKLINSPEAIKDLTEKGDIMDQHLNDDVIVVAATNRPDLIDDALLRPGRFDVILYVPPPNEEERESILHTLTKHKPMENIDLKSIAEKTKYFSGADLKNLCNEVAMNALRQDISSQYVREEHFYEALKKIHPSITKQQIEMYEKLSCKYGTFIK